MKLRKNLLLWNYWANLNQTLLKWILVGPQPSNDYFIKILFLLSKWFQTRRFLWEFPIGSYIKLSLAVAAILVGVLKCWTQFWKRTTQESSKIEISSNGQNCSILSQKVSKFELYKHDDELFNLYYGILLWTLNFCLFWPIMQIRKKGGWNF
jgi:hypothetical protein